jgi:hypothetical protein
VLEPIVLAALLAVGYGIHRVATRERGARSTEHEQRDWYLVGCLIAALAFLALFIVLPWLGSYMVGG